MEGNAKVTGLFLNADEVREYPAGTVIFSAGDTGDEMFGVIDGLVRLEADGRVVADVGPDDVFGEMALIDQKDRMASATAVEDTKVAVISHRHFLFLVHETPTFALQVMAAMADRLRAVL